MPHVDATTEKRTSSPAEVDMDEYDELDPSSADEQESNLIPKPQRWADVRSFKNIPSLLKEEQSALTVRNGKCFQVAANSIFNTARHYVCFEGHLRCFCILDETKPSGPGTFSRHSKHLSV